MDQSVSRGSQSMMKKSIKSGRKGQDLVEFAIVIPLLLLVVFGIFDLGRLFHAGITITSSAREGARFGTLNKEATNEEIIIATRNEALNSGIDLSSSQIDIFYLDFLPLAGPDSINDTIRVRITYDFDFLIDNFFSFTNIQIVRQAEMRFK